MSQKTIFEYLDSIPRSLFLTHNDSNTMTNLQAAFQTFTKNISEKGARYPVPLRPPTKS